MQDMWCGVHVILCSSADRGSLGLIRDIPLAGPMKHQHIILAESKVVVQQTARSSPTDLFLAA